MVKRKVDGEESILVFRGLEDSKSGGSYSGSYGVDVWDHAMMGHKNSIRISILNLHFYLSSSLFLCLFHGHQLF
ncbi:unnamed protein product [Camellia sinensis]